MSNGFICASASLSGPASCTFGRSTLNCVSHRSVASRISRVTSDFPHSSFAITIEAGIYINKENWGFKFLVFLEEFFPRRSEYGDLRRCYKASTQLAEIRYGEASKRYAEEVLSMSIIF